MKNLKLYSISDNYVNYLSQYDSNVLFNKEETRTKTRKYIGIVLTINNHNYFLPLSSPKDSDYMLIDGVKIIRKSIVPIIRIVVKNDDGKDELKGTLKFSSMIPVCDNALTEYNLNNEDDIGYKILIIKELMFIKENNEKIIKNANVIYKQKIGNYNIKYLKNTVNFTLLEEKCTEYIYKTK